MYDFQLDLALIEDKLIGLEDRSRRNNFSADNINEKPDETWGDCKKELDTLLKEILDVEEEVLIERANKVKTDNSKKSKNGSA